MKSFLLLLSLLFAASLLPAQYAPQQPYFPTCYVFAHNVNLRSGPSLDASIVATLPEGTLLALREQTQREIFSQPSEQWLAVRYQDKPAYIWSPLTTVHALKSVVDPDYLFLLGMGDSIYEGKFKVLYQGQKVQELTFEGIKSFFDMHSYTNRGSMGVPMVTDLLYLHYLAESCGEIGGNMVFAFDGKRLHKFADDTGMGDGGFFSVNELALPADLSGTKGLVTFYEMDGESTYDIEEAEKDPYYTGPIVFENNLIHRQRWDGKQLQTALPSTNQGQSTADYYRKLFVFADRVNLRSAPTLDSRVLATLSEGTTLAAMGAAKNDTIGGQRGQWIQVLYQGKPAFVWSKLVSYHALKSVANPDYLFVMGEDEQAGRGKIKVYHQGKKVQELTFERINDSWLDFHNRASMGIDGITDMLYVAPSRYEGRKELDGNILFAFDGQTLRPFGVERFAEGNPFSFQQWVLPSSPEGEKGVIQQLESRGRATFHTDRDGNPLLYSPKEVRVEQKTLKRYRWDGKQLVAMP